MYKDKTVILLLAAAGSGTRLGAEIPKQFIKMEGLSGMSPLQKSLMTAGKVKAIDRVIVITNPEYRRLAEEQMTDLGACELSVELISGGETRQDSVARGVRHCFVCGFDKELYGGSDEGLSDGIDEETDDEFNGGLGNGDDSHKQYSCPNPEETLILVHDAARPSASVDLYDRVIARVMEKGAVVPGVPVKDTIRHIEDGTLDRSKLISVQTPQGFAGNLLLEAVEYAEDSCFVATDEGSLLEHYGHEVSTVLGSHANTKITNPEDMGKNLCVGTGYDVHAFAEGRKLILGGVEIPWEKGLMGHSDADVLTHAFMDGVLGAMCEGDIGLHFPDSDPKYEGVSSLELLKKVGAMMKQNSYTLENADITVICQAPKIRPFVEKMRENLLEIIPARHGINIKGTTTERLGFEGRGEGIAVQATVLLSKMTWGE